MVSSAFTVWQGYGVDRKGRFMIIFILRTGPKGPPRGGNDSPSQLSCRVVIH